MKKLNFTTKTAIALYAMLAVVFFSGCTQESISINEKSNNRIKLNEVRIINGYRYSILEIDSVEYLTQDNGGFVRLQK